MVSDKFDNLIRVAFEGASRRGVVRVGVGALAASALATMGLRAEDADAKKKKKKKKKKPVTVTCSGTRPVTCGNGCCPSSFGVCCDDASEATNSFTCNPTGATCCPADQGGGSCAGSFGKCCPVTTQQPYGQCAPTNGVCCTSAQGGGSCPANLPKCCPGDPLDAFDSGDCCLANQTCCLTDANCPPGQECFGNCCEPVVMNGAPRARSSRKTGAARLGMAVS